MYSRQSDRRVVHQSLIRPVLFGGTEQGVAMVTLIGAVGIPMYGGFHPITIVVGLAVAIPIHALGVWLAKKDPQMVSLYIRGALARDFYLPYGSRKARSAMVRPSIPGTP